MHALCKWQYGQNLAFFSVFGAAFEKKGLICNVVNACTKGINTKTGCTP